MSTWIVRVFFSMCWQGSGSGKKINKRKVGTVICPGFFHGMEVMPERRKMNNKNNRELITCLREIYLGCDRFIKKSGLSYDFDTDSYSTSVETGLDDDILRSVENAHTDISLLLGEDDTVKAAKVYGIGLDSDRHPILQQVGSIQWDGECDTAEKATALFCKAFGLTDQAEEHFVLLALSSTPRPLGLFEVTIGTINRSVIQARELFVRLLLTGASHFIVAHNHPSGSLKPSIQDLEGAFLLEKEAELMGIPMLDFLIVARDDAGKDVFWSYAENVKEKSEESEERI